MAPASRALALIVAGACMGPLLAHAQSRAKADEAMAALKRNDCAVALAAVRQGMADNEPASFFLGGTLAETGTCASADPAAAVRAYERAALLGRRDAAAALALLHAEGSGVPQSYREAGRWYAVASGPSASTLTPPDGASFESPASVVKTYTRAVHDLAYFSLINRLKYMKPIGARVRFDPRTGVATVSRSGPPSLSDAEILSSYKDAVGDLPKPAIPASGDFATERELGADE